MVPRLVGTDEVEHADLMRIMPVSRGILVSGTGSDVVTVVGQYSSTV